MPPTTKGHPSATNATNARGWIRSSVSNCSNSPAAIITAAHRIRRSIRTSCMLSGLPPECGILQRTDVVDGVMAAARHAGARSGLDAAQQFRNFVMTGDLFEFAGAQMAVEAFAVIERCVQLD